MQNARSELEPQPCPHPTYTAEERRAQRVALKSRGINKPGNLKRKVRAARNAKDKERLAASEAKVEELKSRITALEAGAQAAPPSVASLGPPTGHIGRRTLAWPLAASVAPVSPPAPIACTRDPSPEPDPLADYVAPGRAATASPESPEDHWSDRDVSPLCEEDFVGITPPGSPPA